MRHAAFLILLSLLVPFRVFAMGGGPETPPAKPRSSLQLIAEALERNEIDEDTATLYRVYSILDDSKLPPEYRGTAPIRDGTPVLRDARSRYEALRPEILAELEPYLFPRGRR